MFHFLRYLLLFFDLSVFLDFYRISFFSLKDLCRFRIVFRNALVFFVGDRDLLHRDGDGGPVVGLTDGKARQGGGAVESGDAAKALEIGFRHG